ncbi:MAG: hypothetical protein M1431_03905 [Candidatus Thermoplasmatota archaeon]|nr:hypothetical protein [Candidatus Thermoplasmatota archaeon]
MARNKMIRTLESAGHNVKEYGTGWSKSEIYDVPDSPGIYALYWGDTLQYIGMSEGAIPDRVNQWERLDRNKIENIPFGSFDWFTLPKNQVREAEDYLIKY